MAYEIGHKSENEYRIKYVMADKSGRKNKVELPIVIFGLAAIVLGIDILLVIIAAILVAAAVAKSRRRIAFEVVFNRAKNLISVKATGEKSARPMTYPLSSFQGFGYSELRASKKSDGRPGADLFFNFDDDVHGHKLTSRNSLLMSAEQITDEDNNFLWQVPIQRVHHHTRLWNAKKIIASVEKWLGVEGKVQNIEEPLPEPEPEILRDFRDMEEVPTDTPSE